MDSKVRPPGVMRRKAEIRRVWDAGIIPALAVKTSSALLPFRAGGRGDRKIPGVPAVLFDGANGASAKRADNNSACEGARTQNAV